MNIQNGFASLIALGTMATLALSPVTASAQDNHHRHHNPNWENVAIGSAALGVFGLAEHNNTLAVVGIAGAAYSYNRYQQDRNSHDRNARRRYEMYSHSSYNYHGHHYVRHTYRDHGTTYYKFVRG